MPIRPELRHFYRGAAWRETRARILARAGNCCERCGKPNKKPVLTVSGGYNYMAWALVDGGPWRFRDGSMIERASLSFGRRIIRVQLHVAHLNHIAGDENLKALCQWCHFNYDKLHHHETRAERKDRARPLLVGAA